jgi:hypothetical protein
MAVDLDAWRRRAFPDIAPPPWAYGELGRELAEDEQRQRAEAAAAGATARELKCLRERIVRLEKQLNVLPEVLGKAMGLVQRDVAKALGARLDAIEAREPVPIALPSMVDVGAGPVLRDAGVWRAEVGYGVGALVSDRGAAWIAQRITAPGERPPGDGWRLAVKSSAAELRRIVREELGRK